MIEEFKALNNYGWIENQQIQNCRWMRLSRPKIWPENAWLHTNYVLHGTWLIYHSPTYGLPRARFEILCSIYAFIHLFNQWRKKLSMKSSLPIFINKRKVTTSTMWISSLPLHYYGLLTISFKMITVTTIRFLFYI